MFSFYWFCISLGALSSHKMMDTDVFVCQVMVWELNFRNLLHKMLLHELKTQSLHGIFSDSGLFVEIFSIPDAWGGPQLRGTRPWG